MDERDYGTLQPTDDGAVLTFTRRLAHPQEKVWRAVTETEHMAAWFPQTMVGERTAGAKLRFVTSDLSDEGFDGEMLVFEPPKVMEIMWGTDRVRIELQPDGDGTLLTLVDTFGEFGKAARDGAGWHACLESLVVELDGSGRDTGSVWEEVHPAYVERFGPEASMIGPPQS